MLKALELVGFKSFADKTRFEFPPGITVVVGPNGSGKTTFFKAILGLIPSRGDISLDQRSARTFTTQERARALAYVPQIHIPPFPFSAMDIVLMGRTPFIGAFSAPSAEDRREAARAMDLLRIGHLRDRNYAQISGGERQLVLIARALAQSPRFLIMDEPTLHLDFGNQVRAQDCATRPPRALSSNMAAPQLIG